MAGFDLSAGGRFWVSHNTPEVTCPPGTKVEVRGDRKLVKLYRNGELIKVHPRQARGGRSTDPDDYPKELSLYTLRSPDRLRQLSADLGPSVGEFADRLRGGPLPSRPHCPDASLFPEAPSPFTRTIRRKTARPKRLRRLA